MFVTRFSVKERGASLIAAVFLITGLATLGALMTKLMVSGQNETIKEWYAQQAIYAAESAVSYAAYDLFTEYTADPTNCLSRTDIAVAIATNISALYSIYCRQPGQNSKTINYYEITATGTASSGDYMVEREIVVHLIP